MASTRLKNMPCEYKIQQSRFNNHQQYTLFEPKKVPSKSTLGGLGLNPGNMMNGYYYNVLSNNTCNIESNLYGIGSSNLVNPSGNFSPQLNTLGETQLFEKPNNYLPNPLVVEKFQRPVGPFGN